MQQRGRGLAAPTGRRNGVGCGPQGRKRSGRGHLHAPCSDWGLGALGPVACGRCGCTHSKGSRPTTPPPSRTHPPGGAWLLTLNVGGLGGLEEVVLEVQLRVLGQRAPQRLGQHGLEQVDPAQCAAHGMQPQRLLLPQDGAPQVGLPCTGRPHALATRCPPPPCVTRAGQVRASGFVLRSTGRPRRSCQVWTARPGKSPPGRVPLQAGWPSLHQPRVSPSFRRSSGSCGSDAAGGPRKTCWKAGSSGSAAAVGEGREPRPGPPQARGPRGRALTGAAAEGHGHVVVGQGAEGLGLDVHQRGPGEGHVFADGRLGHGPVHQLVLGRHLPAHVAVGPSGDCRVSPARPHPAPWPHVPGRAPCRACAPSSRCLCCPEAGTEGSGP